MSKSEDTRLAEAGRRREWTGGIVNPPVYRASTILFEDVAAMRAADPPRDGTFHYGRSGTPTQWALAEALTVLEPGAAGTRLFPSGVAATSVALMSVLKPGDELLVADSVYGPTRAFCDGVLQRWGVRAIYYDPLIGGGVETLFTERTGAVFMESPGSLSFEVQDVPAICAAARARGIATLLDNTWATPLFFPAVAAGVDLAILSCTKYIVGHSDAMVGSVTAATAERLDMLSRTARAFGQHLSPDDAFLATRGLRTLGLRLRQHQANALAVAGWLREQPEVAAVLHPALPDCPGHEVWRRDFKGASGLFSFVLAGGDDRARSALSDGLTHFGIGSGWGGVESLAIPADPARMRTATRRPQAWPMVRLQIGLEDPADLIADLAKGLGRFRRLT